MQLLPEGISEIRIDSVHLDSETEAFWRAQLRLARVYVEYGSGSSTVVALRDFPNLTKVISIETAEEYADALKRTVFYGESRLSLLLIDLGPTGPWGYPKEPAKNFHSFAGYPTSPFDELGKMGLEADLVLIDGRFRVASLMYSLIALKPGTPVLFDDYFDRSHYQVVERFQKPDLRVGRSAVFYCRTLSPLSKNFLRLYADAILDPS